MQRVHVLLALAECIDNKLIIQDIESICGHLDSDHLAKLEALALKDVESLRSSDEWPPMLHRR